jgi:flagellar biosynthesis/type III secretory pathway protein FliH
MYNNIYDDPKLQKAFNEGYEKGRAEGAKITAEIEHELSAKCNSLAEENNRLREDLKSMETEFVRLRAQMDIVYLIFGGK